MLRPDLERCPYGQRREAMSVKRHPDLTPRQFILSPDTSRLRPDNRCHKAASVRIAQCSRRTSTLHRRRCHLSCQIVRGTSHRPSRRWTPALNGYLKGSFLVPLAATLRSSGLKLDAVAANMHIGRWLGEVANARVHATTKERPDQRLVMERTALLPLPRSAAVPMPAPSAPVPTPIESLQHPLSVYDALLQVAA
jgi:hypothetical protein